MLRGEKVSEKVDIYSFGVILWEIVTLSKPWSELRSIQELITKVGLKDQRLVLPEPWPEQCPRSIRTLILACFEKNPKDRPSFDEIYERMESSIREIEPGWTYAQPE